MNREELILSIIELYRFQHRCYKPTFSFSAEPEFSSDHYKNFSSRFYLVEVSKHTEEDFSVEVMVCYGLRSKEARERNCLDKRRLETFAYSYDILTDVTKGKEILVKEFIDAYPQHKDYYKSLLK